MNLARTEEVCYLIWVGEEGQNTKIPIVGQYWRAGKGHGSRA
jgi:hypothetical protein